MRQTVRVSQRVYAESVLPMVEAMEEVMHLTVACVDFNREHGGVDSIALTHLGLQVNQLAEAMEPILANMKVMRCDR